MTTRVAHQDMGTILKSGEKLNIRAMGESMTAGVRDGGLYCCGQVTAYPNLLARQMGMIVFKRSPFSQKMKPTELVTCNQ